MHFTRHGTFHHFAKKVQQQQSLPGEILLKSLIVQDLESNSFLILLEKKERKALFICHAEQWNFGLVQCKGLLFSNDLYSHRSFLKKKKKLPRLPTFEGEFCGTTPHHEETITMAEYFTLRDSKTSEIISRPTIWFCYSPMGIAIESLQRFAKNDYTLDNQTCLTIADEIVEGRDNLGVLVLGHPFKCWWTGSLLGIEETKKHFGPNSGLSATSLQVGASLSAAITYMV